MAAETIGGGLVFGGVDTGNNSNLPQPVAPDNSTTPADQQAAIQQESKRTESSSTVCRRRSRRRCAQVQELIHEMQGLDPSRFPGNPAVFEALHTQ